MITEIRNATVLSGGKEEKRSVFFEDGKITFPQKADTIIDGTDKYVSSGFIDLHIHGGAGYDFMDATCEAFEKIAEFHALHGTTSMCPTGLSGSVEETVKMFRAYDEADKKDRNGSDFIGIHIEGPYFAFSQKGAQDPKYIHPPKKEEYEVLLSESDKIIRWSVAPELDKNFEFAKVLKEKNIVVSAGHTDADFYQMEDAYINGRYNLMTHFYSCMPSITRVKGVRHAGAIEAAYVYDNIDVEIIADGMHLPHPLLKMIHKLKGAERIALITDAMRGAGNPDGTTSILGSLKNGQTVYIEDGVAKMPDREAFAGSVATTDRLVKNMIKAGASIAQAVQMASETPARIIGAKAKGKLDVGYDADIVIFDKEINVSQVFIRGKKIKQQ